MDVYDHTKDPMSKSEVIMRTLGAILIILLAVLSHMKGEESEKQTPHHPPKQVQGETGQ